MAVKSPLGITPHLGGYTATVYSPLRGACRRITPSWALNFNTMKNTFGSIVFVILSLATSSCGIVRDSYEAQQDYLAPRHRLETNNEYEVIWDLTNIRIGDDTFRHPRIVGAPGKIIANGAKQGWFSSGSVFGIDSIRGDLVWEISGEAGGDMIAQNNILYLGTVGTANVKSYNIETGESLWSTPLFQGHSVSGIYYGENKIFVRDSNEMFFILDEQGEVLDTLYVPYQPFLELDGIFYRKDNFTLKAVERSSQKEFWQLDIGKYFYHPPVFDNGEIFLRTEYEPTNIYSIDQYVGKVNWMISQDILSNLCIIGDKIYFTNRDSYLVAINRYSGNEISRVKFSPQFDLDKQIGSNSVACDTTNNVLAIAFGDNTEIMGLKILNP